MAKKKPVYRIQFHNQGNVFELFARHVSHAEMYGFVEIAGIIFGERSAVLVDPSEEKLKTEFEGVKRTFVPVHAVIRVDEVEREGTNKVLGASEGGKVAQFPMPVYPLGGGSGGQGPGSNA